MTERGEEGKIRGGSLREGAAIVEEAHVRARKGLQRQPRRRERLRGLRQKQAAKPLRRRAAPARVSTPTEWASVHGALEIGWLTHGLQSDRIAVDQLRTRGNIDACCRRSEHR